MRWKKKQRFLFMMFRLDSGSEQPNLNLSICQSVLEGSRADFFSHATAQKKVFFTDYLYSNIQSFFVEQNQMQSLSIVLSEILVLIGLSLTMVGTQLFPVFFPFVIAISFVASFVIGSWFRYSAEVLHVIFDHKAELEKSLGFEMEQLIQKRFTKNRGDFSRLLYLENLLVEGHFGFLSR